MAKEVITQSTVLNIASFAKLTDNGGETDLEYGDEVRSRHFLKTATKKHVTFDFQCRAILVEHLNDYTDDEYFSCWYTPEELAAIRDEAMTTLGMLERKEYVNEVTTTSRGLETQTASGRRYKGERRSTAIETVFAVYDQQAEGGEPIDETIVAAAYKECSHTSEFFAYLSALEDQAKAREQSVTVNVSSQKFSKEPRRNGFIFAAKNHIEKDL